jgi:prolyl-tRNA editing enzyme YbaK/EbsC (Cys-tRNA(Pro) deacylase)
MLHTGDERTDEPRAVGRVRAVLASHGITNPLIRHFDASTATAADAARAIGTDVPRIVKSLVFMADDHPVLVLASGSNRVDLSKLNALLDTKTRRANADEVRQATGFSIGGVPPLAHATRIQTLVDQDLLQFDEVWAAAGTPNSVFAISPATLVELTAGSVADLAQSA